MLSDKQKIENVLNLFLDWNIGDVRKAAHLLPNSWEEIDRQKLAKIHPAYDGGAMVGATILAMCVIHSVSQFSDRQEDEQFKWFVDEYIKEYNHSYDGQEIYALRCSLIKNYALIAKVYEKGKKKSQPLKEINIALTDNGPHYEESKYGRLFNIKEFMIHVQLATLSFFTDVLLEKLPDRFRKEIIKYHDEKKIGPIV